MSHRTVSVDLDVDNLLWLTAQAKATGRRSVSEVLNEVVAKERGGGRRETGEFRSVVGQARISDADPDLAGADEAIRSLFK